MKRLIIIVALIAIALAAQANPFGYLTVLIPLNPGTTPGALGTQWSTTLWASNNSDTDFLIRCQNGGDPACITLKAHTTTAVSAPPSNGHGFFMQVPTGIIVQQVPLNGAAFDLRVMDLSTASHSAGAEIPLARPSDFATALLLPHVPLNGHSRLKLRVYGNYNGTATLRATGATTNHDVVNTLITLSGADIDGNLAGSRYPSYAEYDLPPIAAGDDALRVELASGDPNFVKVLWAFVSVTDNGSEEFTVMAAQSMDYVPLSLAKE